jgi:teichuronic acid biosynthesis glycosyltransferase TuaG
MTIFSVIIPVYNAGAYIEQSLASVFAQTCSDFEVIVVDDGSTDDSADRVNQFSHHPALRYIYQTNAGPAAARNTGLNQAKGQFIAFLDADDMWHPDKLAAHLSRMQRDPKLGLSFNWFEVFYDRPNGERFVPWFAPPTKSTLYWEDFLERNWTGTSSTVVIRAECLTEQCKFDSRFRTSEDYQLWLKIAQAGWKIGFIPEALTVYRRRPHSLTVDYLQIALDELLVMEAGVQPTSPQAQRQVDLAIARRQVDVAWAYFRAGQPQLAWKFLQTSYPAIPQFVVERLARKRLHRPHTPQLSAKPL